MSGNRARGAVIALSVAALCTAYLVFFTRFPTVADEHLALPIARAVADSTLYSSADLIVASGLTGPFHLYRLAGELYARGLDVDLIWFAALIVFLYLTFAATWSMAYGITRAAWVASLATAVLAAASPYRGTLHWFLFPPGNLVTSTAATPFIAAAFALAVWGRWGPALLLAALTFNLHPSMGLIAAGMIALAMIGADGLTWKQRGAWWAGAALCAMPNAYFITTGSPANFGAPPAASGIAFSEQFALYAHHAWISDHWRENYGWFVMQIAGIVFLRRFLAPSARRAVLVMVVAACAFAVAWQININTLNLPAITTTFAMRGAPYVKALVFPALAIAMTQWTLAAAGGSRVIRLACAALLLAGALHKNLDIGEGFAAIAWAGVLATELGAARIARVSIATLLGAAGLVQVLGQGWGILGVAPFSPEHTDLARLATIVGATLFLAAAIATRRDGGKAAAPVASERSAPWAIAVCAATLVLTLGLRGSVGRLRPTPVAEILRAARLAEPDTAVADLVRWAPRGTAAGSLFALPPVDSRFDTFRLAAGRGVYAAQYDVDQLAYKADVYGTAHARLLAQGMVVRGRHDFDGAAWDTLSAPRIAALAREGVAYAVFTAEPRLTRPLEFPVVFQDRHWIVYDVRSAR